MNRQSTDFQGSENGLYNTMMMDTYQYNYTFVQTHKMYNTKNEP